MKKMQKKDLFVISADVSIHERYSDAYRVLKSPNPREPVFKNRKW